MSSVRRNLMLSVFVATVSLIFIPGSHAAGALEEQVLGLFQDAPEHPRLLMGEEAEAALRVRIAENEEVGAVFLSLRREADAMLKAPPSEMIVTGKRLLSVSREVLRRVWFLSLAHRITGERPYAERAIVEMEAAAAFPSWNPSHFLDTAEMTAALAIGYDWLYGLLTEEQEAAIRGAILEKGIAPSYDAHRGWLKTTNNWNPVCHGGLTFGALALLEKEPELAAQVVARAVEGVPGAMALYAPDGVYPEGPSYWEYGITYNVMFIAALEFALGTDFGLKDMEGFLPSGAFPLLMTGPTGSHFNFSDCGGRGGPFPAVYWFAQHTGDSGIGWAEHSLLKSVKDGRATNRFLPLLLLYWDGTPPAPPRLPLHWKGEGLNPLATHRTSWTDENAVFLAVKAGSPGAPHGHMDIGSFVLDADGKRWALDFGMQGYHELESRGMGIWNRGQTSDRWRVYRYHNSSHNTLLVDDIGQMIDAKAEITHFSDAPDFPHTIMDMGAVYAGQLAHAIRGFALLPDNRVLIQDEISAGDTPARVRWAMTTPADVDKVQGNTAELVQQDKRLHFHVLSPADVVVETFSTEPPNEWDAPNPGTRQIGFYVDLEPGVSQTIAVVLTPGSAVMSASPLPPPDLRALDTWYSQQQ